MGIDESIRRDLEMSVDHDETYTRLRAVLRLSASETLKTEDYNEGLKRFGYYNERKESMVRMIKHTMYGDFVSEIEAARTLFLSGSDGHKTLALRRLEALVAELS